MRIADDEVAFMIDAQARGAAVAIIGRRPGYIEKLAVAVERLNARRPIDEVESILGTDGNRPRLDELAPLHATLPPDELWFIPCAGTARRYARKQQPGPDLENHGH